MSDPAQRRAELSARLDAVRSRIGAACAAAGRDAAGITLVVVTKTHPVDDLVHLAALGVRDIGENREQEFTAKHEALAGAVGAAGALLWHFIGRLQTNKARRVAASADLIHSVDREALLAPLGRGAVAAGRELEVLLQVSLDGDPDRGGVPVHEGADPLLRLAGRAAETSGLSLRGLMAVAPLGVDPARAFAVLPRLSERLCAEHPRAVLVSAGMSGDLEAAVAAGATHLRVGSAILGQRAPLG